MNYTPTRYSAFFAHEWLKDNKLIVKDKTFKSLVNHPTRIIEQFYVETYRIFSGSQYQFLRSFKNSYNSNKVSWFIKDWFALNNYDLDANFCNLEQLKEISLNYPDKFKFVSNKIFVLSVPPNLGLIYKFLFYMNGYFIINKYEYSCASICDFQNNPIDLNAVSADDYVESLKLGNIPNDSIIFFYQTSFTNEELIALRNKYISFFDGDVGKLLYSYYFKSTISLLKGNKLFQFSEYKREPYNITESPYIIIPRLKELIKFMQETVKLADSKIGSQPLPAWMNEDKPKAFNEIEPKITFSSIKGSLPIQKIDLTPDKPLEETKTQDFFKIKKLEDPVFKITRN